MRATACNAASIIPGKEPPWNLAPPMIGKDICPALPVLTSRRLVPVSLVSAVGEIVTCTRHIPANEYGAPSSQLTQELDDEELLELPLLRLCTDGATAIEVGLPHTPTAPNARASSNKYKHSH